MTARHLMVKRSEVEPGESWYAAAVRKSGDPLNRPWAVDLSGQILMFGIGQGPADVASLDIRPVTREDFSVICAWQSMPHVARWWNDDTRTTRDLERHYGPALEGTDPTRLWLVEVNGRPCGFLQDYCIADYPDYAGLTGRADAIGFDYLLGDPQLVGKGVGTRVVWTFLHDVVAPAYDGATTLFAAPDHRNVASRRMLEKLGFTAGETFEEPQAKGDVDTVIGYALDIAEVMGVSTPSA
jgi:aminoglycoside 6'-N-acetyltransferase